MNTASRNRRRKRIRSRVFGTSARPRASVHRSLKYISVQLIDDAAAQTLAAARGRLKEAKTVGGALAALAVQAGVKTVAFDRGGYRYHGRVKALAEGMREGGLKF